MLPSQRCSPIIISDLYFDLYCPKNNKYNQSKLTIIKINTFTVKNQLHYNVDVLTFELSIKI